MLDGLKFSLQRTQKKIPKAIPKISKKKQERIKEHGSESDLFKAVWAERKHECEKCGKELFTPRVHNFGIAEQLGGLLLKPYSNPELINNNL